MLIRLRSFQTSQHRNETEHLKRQPEIMKRSWRLLLNLLGGLSSLPKVSLGEENWGTGKQKQKITEIIVFAGQQEAKHHLLRKGHASISHPKREGVDQGKGNSK